MSSPPHFGSPPDRLLHRTRLLGMLEQFHGRRVVLVHGKAGQGKSTLVQDFLQNKTRAWHNLGEEDRAPDRLLRSLCQALSSLGPPGGSQGPRGAAAPDDLAGALEPVPAQSVHLVLDDLQRIRGHREPLQLLDALLSKLPSRLHVVLVSRGYPDLALARLRSQRQLVEISDAELAFRREEVEQLLCSAWGVPLEPAQIDALTDISGGWVTALVHLAAALETKEPSARSAELRSFLQRGSLPTLDEYFEREVLKELQPAEAQALAELAPFGSLSRELAAELLGQRAAALLDARRSECYFLHWRDSSLGVFGFHGLFAAYLRRRFAALPAARRRRVHTKAAEFFQGQGQIVEALHHVLQSGELERAAQLLEGQAEGLLEQSQYDKLQELLEGFPPQFRETHPLLAYYQAITSNLLQPLASREALRGLLQAFEGQGDYDRVARIYVVLLANYLFYQGNRDAVEELAGLGQSFLLQRGGSLEAERRELLSALLSLSRWWTRPESEEAFEMAMQAEEASRRANNAELLILSQLVLARIHLDRGHFEESRRILGDAEELIARHPGCGLYEASLRFYLGDAYFYLGDLPRALEQVVEGQRRSCPGFPFCAYLRLNQALYLLYMPGAAEVSAAAEILATLGEAKLAENLYVRYYSVYLLRMLLACRRDSREQALYYCRRLQAPESRPLLQSDYPYSYLALAETLISFGEHESALRALEALPRQSAEEENRHPYPCATAWALEGLIRTRQGEAEAARGCFGRLVRLLETRGYRNLDICSPTLLLQVAEACQRSIGGGLFHEFRRLRVPAGPAASGSPPLLDIRSLGEFRVFIGEQELPAATLSRQRKVIDLLKLLVVHRQTGMVKEVLYDVFWPGYLPKSCRDNLNSIIYRLRRTLGEEHPYVLSDGATLTLNPELCRVDADRFLEALALAERAWRRAGLPEAAGEGRGEARPAQTSAEARELCYRAKALYAGDFLQNDLYYDDIRDAREALLNSYLQLLFRLTLMSLEAAEHQEALSLARELVQKDPLCEPAYRLLMIACRLVGNRSDVPRVVERLSQRLKRAYGIRPDPRTMSLQKLLLEGDRLEATLWREEVMI